MSHGAGAGRVILPATRFRPRHFQRGALDLSVSAITHTTASQQPNVTKLTFSQGQTFTLRRENVPTSSMVIKVAVLLIKRTAYVPTVPNIAILLKVAQAARNEERQADDRGPHV